MKGAPGHIDGLDLAWGSGFYGFVIALANEEVILDDSAERRERQSERAAALGPRIVDVEDEAPLGDR